MIHNARWDFCFLFYLNVFIYVNEHYLATALKAIPTWEQVLISCITNAKTPPTRKFSVQRESQMFLQMGIKPHEAVLLAKLLRRQATRRQFLKINSPSKICLATVALLSSPASESMVIRTDSHKRAFCLLQQKVSPGF